MATDLDDFDFPEDYEVCPRCMGNGEVPCHCGGDLCVCSNYGDAPCPTCHGDGEVTHERAERYLAAERRFHEQMQKLWNAGQEGRDAEKAEGGDGS